jgi:hypothetical protein
VFLTDLSRFDGFFCSGLKFFFFQDSSLLPVKNEELAFWVVWGSVLSCAGSFSQPKAGLGCFGLKTKRVNAGIK